MKKLRKLRKFTEDKDCKLNKMSSVAIKVVALVCVLIFHLGGPINAAFAAPNEKVGHRACVHLMLRLVDCLLDACDLYLRNAEPGAAMPDSSELMGVGASGLQRQDIERGVELAAGMLLGDLEPSTHPMNWVPPAPKQQKPKANITDQANPNNRTGCPVKAVKWLRQQLLNLRKQLASGARANLSECLSKFSQFSEYLASNCPQLSDDSSFERMDELAFISEAVQVLAEIHQETQMARVSKDSKEGAKERNSTEALKQHYAYLTQIITSYNLVFNAIDSDLMGPDNGDSLADGSNGLLDKSSFSGDHSNKLDDGLLNKSDS